MAHEWGGLVVDFFDTLSLWFNVIVHSLDHDPALLFGGSLAIKPFPCPRALLFTILPPFYRVEPIVLFGLA